MSDPRRTRLEEHRDTALTELRDLELQVAAGEIDSSAATLLQQHSQVAAADAMNALDRLGPVVANGRSMTRLLIGVGTFFAIAAVVTVTLVSAVEPRPDDGFVTGGIAADVRQDPIDLSTITNEEMEQVVAANPEILPMRLALARRYLEAGDFSGALPHYLFVLDRETNPEALMYVGWMTYVSGEADTGAALLRQSLEILPNEPLAEWFLANALFYGTGDTEAAIPLLQAVIESGAVPEEISTEAEVMLREASR